MAVRKRRATSNKIDEYFEDMERWAEQVRETFTEKPSWDLENCAIEPLRDMTVTPREVIVTVDLPYAEKKTVQVKAVDAASLEILAEMKRKIRLHELGVTYREGVIQRFHSWIHIPVRVDMQKMKVQQKKGILEIKLPRKR